MSSICSRCKIKFPSKGRQTYCNSCQKIRWATSETRYSKKLIDKYKRKEEEKEMIQGHRKGFWDDTPCFYLGDPILTENYNENATDVSDDVSPAM